MAKTGEQRIKKRHKTPQKLPQLEAKTAKTAKKKSLENQGNKKTEKTNNKSPFYFCRKKLC